MPVRRLALATVALASLLLGSTDAAATAQRTFVASTGNDVNPCSLVAPCRSFAASIAQASAGGEVIVLDSAGYGPVTVTQSVSIVAPTGVYAGISVPATGDGTGVVINTPGVAVVLRGLTINGIGGTYGVRMHNGAKLTIENCEIANFSTGVAIATPAEVSILGSTVRDNDSGLVAGSGAVVNVANSQALRNHSWGIVLFGGGPGTSTKIFLSDTVVTGSTDCVDNLALPGAYGTIVATRVTAASCGSAFINEPFTAGNGTMSVGRSTATNSGTGFSNGAGSTFLSLGDNQLSGNTSDIVGVITFKGGQ